MAGWILLGTLAAFGALCVLWMIFGVLLPCGRKNVLIAAGRPGETEVSFVRRYLWLRGMGWIQSPLVIVDLGLSPSERAWFESNGIEICSLAEVSDRLGIGAESI